MSLLPVGFGASGDDYEITDSLRLRSSASAYLTRTFSTPTDNKKWTFSFWFKRGTLGTVQTILSSALSGNEDQIYFPGSADTFRFYIDGGIGDAQTVAVFRDPSAWYHMIVVCDTANATATDRAIIYVNGVRQTVTGTNFPLNAVPDINGARLHYFGRYQSGAYYTDGYLTEVNFIDGQALTPSDFGEYDDNGTWKPLAYTGTYGNNGFYLPMKPTTQAELQNTVLYAGNTNKQSIDGVGYAPDFVWIKNRTGANNHYLYDTIRGTDRSLLSNSTSADNVGAQQLTSFDTDGFTVPYDVSGYNNYAGRNYVAWTWDAGDNQTSTGISSVLYVGQGAAGHSVKGFGFSPDFVWIKNRTGSAQNHMLFDSVRGANLRLQSDSNATEFNQTNSLISFDADGFSLGTSTGNLNVQNNNYVAWGWDAGDGDPVSNTDGSITSTVKANDATGFSIVSYTGDGSASSTVGHGLSSSASMLIVKDRAVANNWRVWHKDLSANNWLYLNLTNAQASGATDGGIRNVNATTFGFINGTTAGVEAVNTNGRNYIAYAFSEVSGVSSFGTYPGNGSTTGPVVTTGFRPGFVMTKRIDSSGNWYINDGTRSPFNPTVPLYADSAIAESGNGIDLLSNGFQIKNADGSQNASGGTYIYMAFKGSYSDYVSPLNDTGTIDSRVKANPSKGFSIVTHTGNGSLETIGHGLGVAPSMFISKSRSSAYNWHVYHASLGNTKAVFLNLTDAAITSINYFNNTSPTSTVFTLNSAINVSGNNYVTYCFAEVAGYSKIDSYTGTNAAGNSVTTGFRPAFVMVKNISSATSWNIIDSTRNPVGTQGSGFDSQLYPNLANAESTGGDILTFTDTGFVINVTSSSQFNASGATYIYMAFADTRDAVFNFDASGNKNNWLPNNINSNADSETTYDLMKDTPSLVDENAGNFATLNPLDDPRTYVTYSDANLTVTNTTSNAHSPFISTIGMAPNSGKYYWESIGVGNSNTRNATGIGTAESMGSTTLPVGFISNQAGLYIGSGTAVYFYDESGTSTFNVAWAAGNVFMHCYDANTGKFWVGQNGVWYNSSGGTTGDPATGTNPTATLTSSNTYFPLGTVYNNSGSYLYYNFGQRPLAYTPPTGFLKLNTFNLPDSTIEDGSDYFEAITRNGFGSSGGTVATNFQADLIWEKPRNAAYSHYIIDNVRGIANGTAPFLSSNTTSAEQNANWYLPPTSSTIGFNSSDWSTSTTIVDWIWKANGSGSSNTDGSVTATVSANTTAGFSIVGFTAPSGTGNFSVGHGLGVTPAMVIVKTRDSGSAPWYTWQNTFSNLTDDYIRLNATSAKQTQSSGWGAGMTSSVIGLRAGYTTVATEDHIAYCFAEVEGYSAFGSYTGNGSTDGPFIYTGFRPSFVIFKSSNQTTNWMMFDTTINPINEAKSQLWPNLANAENTNSVGIDFLSNGIKLRGALTATNAATSYNYIYMAFAENPFKNANAR